MIARRRFLSGLIAAAIAPRFVQAEVTADGFTILRAAVMPAALMGADGPKTDVWSYGSWPQPILRVKQGEELKIRFVNMLDRSITIHWHGVRGPAGMMSLTVAPGEDKAFDCIFTPPDAGTFFFGPVADVSRQRDMGLYGVLIVEEKEPPGDFADVPLVLDDWQLDNDGRPEDTFGSLDDAIAEGRLGNWFTVNGAYRPQIKAETNKPIRLRVVNAANVRTMGVLLKGVDPLLIALDGQPIGPRHLGADALKLAPLQRADLLIQEGAEAVTFALDMFEDVVEVAYLARSGEPAQQNIPDNFALPPNPIPSALNLDTAQTVPVVLEGGAKGGLKAATLNGETLELRALLEKGYAWAINGVAGLGADPMATMKQGDTVIFAIDNRTAFEQPLYIHGHVWRMIERDGMALENEPWRDTALAPPRKSIKLAFVADNPGRWGLQSTIAERIDSGLFTTFAVEQAAPE